MASGRSIALCVLSALLLCGGALQLLSAEHSRAAMNSSVRIALRGQVPPKCSLSDMDGQVNFDAASLGRQGQSAVLGFTIDCNTPFIYQLSAAHGAMELKGSQDSAGGRAAARLPYRVSLAIPTDDGGTLRADCRGEMLSAGASRGCDADSGHAVAINQRGHMGVKLIRDTTSLNAGQYMDNLRITLNVKQ